MKIIMKYENIIELLDRRYQSFINQKQEQNWDFCLYLIDYVNYATKTPEIGNILKDIAQKGKEAEERLKRCAEGAIKEIEEVKDKIFQRIKEKKISYENLNTIESLDMLMNEYKYYKGREELTPQEKTEFLDKSLKKIIKSLWEHGHKKIIKDLIIEERMPSPSHLPSKNFYIRDFTCFKNLEAYYDEKKFYNKKRDIELWGPWSSLDSLYLLFMPNEKEGLEQWQIKKNAYISDVTRLHNHLIQELRKEEAKKITKEETPLLKDRKIKKITLINENNYRIAINNHYKEIKKIPKYSDWWKIFVQEIKNRNIPWEKRTDVKEIPKEMSDYFNYNTKCPIYFKGKYKLTNIFTGRNPDIMINPEIETEIISEKKYLSRLKRQKKK